MTLLERQHTHHPIDGRKQDVTREASLMESLSFCRALEDMSSEPVSYDGGISRNPEWAMVCRLKQRASKNQPQDQGVPPSSLI